MRNFFILSLSVFLFSSCLKSVDLDSVFIERYVIVGSIANGETAVVKLSKTVSKTDENTFPVISNAVITLKNGTDTEILKYTGNSFYQSEIIAGKPGETYSVEVAVEGEIFRAETTMPFPSIWLDSLGFKEDLVFDQNDLTEILDLYAFARDSADTEDYGFFKLTNHGTEISPDVFYDEKNQTSCPWVWNLNWVQRGQTFEVQMFQTEEVIYEYFSELSRLTQQINLVGLSVAPPGNLKGNFDNEALGYFGAVYKSDIVTIVAE